MTKKVLVLVEGPTEEAFIKHVVAPSLPGTSLIPTVVKTKVTGAQPEKGGFVKYNEFKRQLNLLLRDSSASMVTTMLDYQGIGSDFPGRKTPGGNTSAARAEFVEAAMKGDIADTRYCPNLTLHEFEALLFVRPEIIADVLQYPRLANPLRAIRARYPATPEEINDSAATSPSARIETTCREVCGSPRVFRKRMHGPIIAGRIGLTQIRGSCPHFDGWLKKLEAFAAV
ncbi:MAG: DUF4276 family protein [Opitutaceae bacterium]|nr:DUF4276 family protein [Opitutaceae bacterium]